jgi:hypothetical protein
MYGVFLFVYSPSPPPFKRRDGAQDFVYWRGSTGNQGMVHADGAHIRAGGMDKWIYRAQWSTFLLHEWNGARPHDVGGVCAMGWAYSFRSFQQLEYACM